MTLTDRHRRLLRNLQLLVVMHERDHVLARYYPDCWRHGRRDLLLLRGYGLVERWRVPAKPLIQFKAPKLIHDSKDPLPPLTELYALVYDLHVRASAPLEMTYVYTLGPRAESVLGLRPAPFQPSHVAHDLQMTQLYWFMAAHFPERVEHWVAEHEIKAAQEANERLADAMVLHPTTGHPYLQVEYGGRYALKRILNLLEDGIDRAARLPKSITHGIRTEVW